MLNLINKYSYEYNSFLDILYVDLQPRTYGKTYSEELASGVIFNYSRDTNYLVSVEIWDFKRKILNKIAINMPFEIDFNEIYKSV